jgi:hypothetical protein
MLSSAVFLDWQVAAAQEVGHVLDVDVQHSKHTYELQIQPAHCPLHNVPWAGK